MMFEQNPGIYKRIAQGLVVLSAACALDIGLKVLKRDYDLLKRRIPLPVAASSLALFYNSRYKRLTKKPGEKNDSKQ